MDPEKTPMAPSGEGNQQPPPYPISGQVAYNPYAPTTQPYPAPYNPQFQMQQNPVPYNPNPGFGYNPAQGPDPHQSQGSVSESILAAQAVTAAISQNGRNPVTVVCPNCKTTTVTKITEVEVTAVTHGTSKMVYMFFAGTAAVFLCFFIAVTFISGSYIPLFVMPVFLLFLLVGFCVMRKAVSTQAEMCKDIQHHCSACHTLLGVSSGVQMMQQMQRNNRRFRRSY